jgi:hypothetical protein
LSVLSMDMESRTTESSPSGRKNRSPLLYLALGAILAFVLVIAFILFTSSHRKKIVWMSPAEVAQAVKGGMLRRMKYWVIRQTAPLLRYYHPQHPSIIVDASVLKFSAQASGRNGLGVPISTNADGMRAWILSPTELKDLQTQFKTNDGITVMYRPRIQTRDGMPAILSPGNLTLNLFPKVVSGSVKMILSVTSPTAFPLTPAVQTNLISACAVLTPNGGALVLDAGKAMDTNGGSYWFILSPVVVDARGNPIKP